MDEPSKQQLQQLTDSVAALATDMREGFAELKHAEIKRELFLDDIRETESDGLARYSSEKTVATVKLLHKRIAALEQQQGLAAA